MTPGSIPHDLAPGALPTGCHHGETLVVIGCAPSGVRDAVSFLSEYPAAWTMAVNAAIADWPGWLDFAATLHPECLRERTSLDRLAPWITERTAAGRNRPFAFGPHPACGVNIPLHISAPLGSSGMFAALVGVVMGFSQVVLAGVTLDRPDLAPYLDIWEAAAARGWLDNVCCITPGPLADMLGARVVVRQTVPASSCPVQSVTRPMERAACPVRPGGALPFLLDAPDNRGGPLPTAKGRMQQGANFAHRKHVTHRRPL